MESIKRYFPDLNNKQLLQFSRLEGLYREWNLKINVISRKDVDQLYIRHVLHSLAIAKYLSFSPNTKVLDVGTGGGFPGIPLAIFFPQAHFLLIDSIKKKIRVVDAIIADLQLENCSASHIRAEQIDDKFDFVVSRAVTAMPKFVSWVSKSISMQSRNTKANGILALKGGNLEEELAGQNKATIIHLSDYFSETFFETKKLVHLII